MGTASGDNWLNASLRWILVLPASVLGFFAAKIIVGSVLSPYWDSDSAHPDPSFKLAIFRFFLEPGAAAAAFVWAGAWVSPNRKFSVSVALSSLFACWLVVLLIHKSQSVGFHWSYITHGAFSVIGLLCCVGYFKEDASKRKARETASSAPKQKINTKTRRKRQT